MKLKTLHVDFNDSTLGTIAREGEHNRTQLVFVLDEDLQACDFINVEFGVESSGDKLVLENLCPEEDEGTLKVSLTQDVTVSGVLTIQLVGYVVDSATAEPQIIAKSPVMSGAVTPSINGIKKIAQGVAGLLDRILAKVNDLAKKSHTHTNKNTLDLFSCQAVDTGIESDASSTDLKWQGKSVAFDNGTTAVISGVEEIEKDGAKFLRLSLSQGGVILNKLPDYIDIPVSGVTDVEEEIAPDITINGSEIIFPTPEPENTEEIPLVTELPENAEFGDMCLYARANNLTAEDTGTTIYINPEWLNNVSANRQNYVWEIGISGYSLLFTITVSVTETTASFDAYTYGTGEQWGYHLYFKRDATENLVLNTEADNHYSDGNGKVTLTEMPKSLKIPQFEATRIINPDCPFTLFYHEPELMIYRDEWVELLSAGDIERLEESSHTHANAETLENFTEDADGNLLYKGEEIGSEGLSAYFDGDTLVLSNTVLDEIEQMIDESGVLG